ncbi:MAG TPA: hypothetical protein DG577_04495, partial [Firmicutes bacterium]|nr:hypothetical protein [Bacillota bacterium]
MTENHDFPDVRTLFALVLVITSLAIAINDPLWLTGLLAVSLAALLAAKIPLSLLGRRLRRYRWLFLILALAQSLSNGSGRVFLD